jgi:hypothetical protein
MVMAEVEKGQKGMMTISVKALTARDFLSSNNFKNHRFPGLLSRYYQIHDYCYAKKLI